MLGADVAVAEAQGLAEGELQGLLGGGVEGDELGNVPGGRGQGGGRGGAYVVRRDLLGAQGERGEALRLGEQAEDEVLGADLGVAGGTRLVLRGDDDVAGAGVKRPKPWLGSIPASPSLSALGTKRFWAAWRVTPMLRPMSVQEAPERRAWSTKWPMRWSATSPRDSATTTAPLSCSRVSVWTFLMASIRSSRRTGLVMRTGSTEGFVMGATVG